MAGWRENYEIIWHHGKAPDGVEKIVREDLETVLQSLAKPSDLVFHDVWLSDDAYGAGALVWGVLGDDRFHAQYRGAAAFDHGEVSQ